jgi:L-lactate dehydrogenase complex protein LldG
MSSREKILKAISANKPVEIVLPEVPLFGEGEDFVEKFKNILTFIGGYSIELSENEISQFIKNQFPNAQKITSDLIEGNFNIDISSEKNEIEKVDLAILKGEFGVAENAAIWLPENNMLNRALPFLTQHLVLVIEKKSILPNMHHAYKRISSIGNYGVFIAGPSKTADIEQSLVIGAHGARSMTVILI